MVAETRIDELNVRVYEVPTDQPEADGTIDWTSSTMVVVQAIANGQVGLGYTYASAACKPIIEQVLAPEVVDRPVLATTQIWLEMVRAVRNLGRPGLAGCAISAVDTALWDLKARLLNVPLSRLLGGVRQEVLVYGSGGFTTYTDETMRRQIEGWMSLGISRFKIKIGEARGTMIRRDLHRIAAARKLIGTDADLFVDANGAYTRKQAIRLGTTLEELGIKWFEEPVSSNDLVGLSEVRARVTADVTAGEYGYDLGYFERMCAAGAVDCLQIDVTRCGGYTEWLRAAAVAAGHELEVSAHCAPNLHAHVAAAVPNTRHIEYFHDHARVEAIILDGVLTPLRGVMRLDLAKKGNGLQLRAEQDIAQYQVA